MNTAAIRIYKKYHGNDSKIKLPPVVVIVGAICAAVFVSAVVSVNIADIHVQSMIRNMPDTETIYVQETGKYPDWFLEWLNTEYYLQMQELGGGGNGTRQELD